MRVVFANSPILETVCDFQFEPRQPWDWTVPGLLYERVRTTFPLKQEQRNFEVNVPPIPGNETMPMQQAVTRLQFLREDKRALIQVGPNFLAVNHLRPYPTWEPYKKMVFANLAHYVDIAEPGGIRSIGLRYINHIEFPEPVEATPLPASLYTKALPGIPDKLLGAPVRGFLQRIEIPSPSGHGVLAIQSGTVPSNEPNRVAFLLDLAFTASFQEPMPVAASQDWIEQAHTEIEEAFLASITPQARKLFGEMTHE